MSSMRFPATASRTLLPAALALLLALAGCASASQPDTDHKEILVFDTMATAQGGQWIVPLRGRVYEPKTTVVRKSLFAALMQEAYGVRETPETAQNYDDRIRWFVSEGKSGQELTSTVGDETVEIGPSESNGYFDTNVAITRPASSVNETFVVQIALAQGDHRPFEGQVTAPRADAVMIVSDIDDTIKVSHVTNTAKLLEYTFYREYEAVPGMVALYRRWSDGGAAFHYVSSSPWQLYVPLREFMRKAGYPPGAMHLKRVNFTDGTFLNLFKSGTETKPARIVALLERFPDHRFILVGDSGEQDPEVYATVLRQHPQQVARIFIRNVTGEMPTDPRFQDAFAGIERSRWALFVRPADLSEAVDLVYASPVTK